MYMYNIQDSVFLSFPNYKTDFGEVFFLAPITIRIHTKTNSQMITNRNNDDVANMKITGAHIPPAALN